MLNYKVEERVGSRLMWRDVCAESAFCTLFAKATSFLEQNQLYQVELWKKFVDQYRTLSDSNDGRWRCEYWGKMMRGAALMCDYTRDESLYRVLEQSVLDMLSAEEPDGRLSTYSRGTEFTAWDLWGRKYVLLGMQYFAEICRDDALTARLINSMCRQADYILAHIGSGSGQKEICRASRNYQGLNSCSILEPMVRLYRITGEERYLRFAEYIISTGFIESGDLIQLASEDKKAPFEYPVVKAYEMMSCFEGLLQYDCLFDGRYRHAILNFGYRIMKSELSIIGCSGCTHELFDHTRIKQTQTNYEDVVQETCVAVTWMRFAAALLELSGDARFADCIETTFYNAYLGSLNTHLAASHCEFKGREPATVPIPTVMPFDSYNPLTAEERGRKVGGYSLLADRSFYGCCACIGAAGLGGIPRMAVLQSGGGIVLNYYEQGYIRTVTPKQKQVTVRFETRYPFDGEVQMTLQLVEDEVFDLALRIPAWCQAPAITVNQEAYPAQTGYVHIKRQWSTDDKVVLKLPMPIRRVLPDADALNSNLFAAYCRGPIVLSADKRITDPTKPIAVRCEGELVTDASFVDCPEIPDCNLCVSVGLQNGARARLIDYASAGKTWDEQSLCAAWLLVESL